ncbi:MAG: HAMP domain-containing histidine kinase, partial [Sphingobacteriales bacterium]
AFHLDALKKIQVSEDKNREQAALAELREQFIAILGHDLRNPLGATISSAQMLKLMHLDEASSKLVNVVYSASQRMKKLIDNIVDFAGARMGNGLAANIKLNNDMEAVLQEVIKEFAQSHPDTNIITNIRLLEPVYCDSNRVAQLFSNLLSNAISHGEKHQPIYVEAVTVDHEFILSIKNSGKQIPDALREHLFQPFFRGKADSREGLGLGLFIAAEITKAHDGTLSVHSDDEATVFTLRLPSAVNASNTK